MTKLASVFPHFLDFDFFFDSSNMTFDVVVGTFRLDYEYEIEYEYDFRISNQ